MKRITLHFFLASSFAVGMIVTLSIWAKDKLEPFLVQLRSQAPLLESVLTPGVVSFVCSIGFWLIVVRFAMQIHRSKLWYYFAPDVDYRGVWEYTIKVEGTRSGEPDHPRVATGKVLLKQEPWSIKVADFRRDETGSSVGQVTKWETLSFEVTDDNWVYVVYQIERTTPDAEKQIVQGVNFLHITRKPWSGRPVKMEGDFYDSCQPYEHGVTTFVRSKQASLD